MDAQFSQSRLIWTPKDPARSRVEGLRRLINRKHGLNLKDYHDLHKYSVTDYTFWQDLWEHFGIIYSVPPEKILVPGKMKEVPEWFPGARLNYAENLLRHDGDAIAVTAARETGDVKHISYRQLKEMVRQTAAAMRAHGLQKGDRVAAIVTNNIHVIVIALAAASIGAMFSSTATDMGAQGVLDRYMQIRPKLVFAEIEVVYATKTIDLMPNVKTVVDQLWKHGLQRVILLPSAKTGKEASVPSGIPNCYTWSGFLASGDNRPLSYEQVPFNHPFFILYSSGTTGVPKCIVHSVGGLLINGMKEHILSYDMGPEDTYFQYTTPGWMMWNSMLPALSQRSRLIAYDGSPFHPSLPAFLKFVSDQGVTIFGTGPRWLAEIQARGIEPRKLAPFASLRTIMSTGAPLTVPLFAWTQETFGDIHLTSVSGGTDICAGFVTSSPVLPTYSGEMQAKALGMAVEIWDDNGKNIEDTGLPGELVCVRPHPTLPVCFWGDEDNEKYRKAYFDTWPGIWRHSDFIVKNPKTGGFVILGRSDGVLNPSGVRFGSAEIYAVLDQFRDQFDDTLCVGQRRPQDKDERVLLFCKMRPNVKFTDELVQRVKTAIRRALSARHVPAYVFEVADIPYTVNNKKIEIAVKQIVSGYQLKPSGTVANPESLKLYYKYHNLEQLLGGAKARL
ncbi:acetoacetate-CoA ligase [Trametopsis cervina]|nr:acetoacetate-CoA ligase [Trametopsis cervina]